MDKDQIQALIDSTISGQGNQVDSGGKLAQILTGILEIAAAGGNVQSDWNQTDDKKEDYIKNKPTIPEAYVLPVATAETLGGVKVGNGLTADEAGKLSLLNVVVITEDLSSGNPVEISEDRYQEITNYPFVIYDGKLKLFASGSGFHGENVVGANFGGGKVFVDSFILDEAGTIDTMTDGIACYFDQNEQKYFLCLINK